MKSTKKNEKSARLFIVFFFKYWDNWVQASLKLLNLHYICFVRSYIYYVDWGFDAVGTDLLGGLKHTVPYFHTVLALAKFLGVSQVKVKVWNLKDKRSS